MIVGFPQKYDVIVLGAGAAGLMCAMTAGAAGVRVLLIDHNDKAGAKILISGGGRCNFTNIGTTHQNFLSENPQFCRSALARYSPEDFLSLIAHHNIAWHEKTLGQLFCDGSAKQIVAMLLAECAISGVEIKLATRISAVSKPLDYMIETTVGEYEAKALVLATGGLSIPKMGATGLAYDVAKKFGVNVIAPRPGLVPLLAPLHDLDFYADLAGVSVKAAALIGKTSFTENILFTHRGLSGPAILQISSYLKEGDAFSLDVLPGVDIESYLKDRQQARPKAELKTHLAEILPQRLATAWTESSRVNDLKNWIFTPSGSEGFAKSEVTVGGIDTNDLSSKTMEAKLVPGLYAIGEAVDVTGWLGGYNFQWAWASGWAAGRALGKHFL